MRCAILYHFYNLKNVSDALRDLVPFVQFKKREKHPWRSVTFSKVAGFSSKTNFAIERIPLLHSHLGGWESIKTRTGANKINEGFLRMRTLEHRILRT